MPRAGIGGEPAATAEAAVVVHPRAPYARGAGQKLKHAVGTGACVRNRDGRSPAATLVAGQEMLPAAVVGPEVGPVHCGGGADLKRDPDASCRIGRDPRILD